MKTDLRNSVNENSKKTLLKIPCVAFLFGGLIYNWVLPFCWGNDPFDAHGTLSLLCEHRQPYFWLWIVLVYGGALMNLRFMYKKYDCKSKLLDAVNILMAISAVAIALTLDHSIENWNAKRVIHWIVTITLIVFLALSILIFCLKNIKRQKAFVVLTAVLIAIVGFVALWFLFLGKSAMMEVIPTTMVSILLFVVNFTPAVKKKF